MFKALHPGKDVISISSLVDSLKHEKYDSILIYKPKGASTLYGPPDLDALPNGKKLFALGFQTLQQKKMMVKGSQEILCIDATHNTNQYEYQLINLIVPDQYGCGYPVAHFLTNCTDINTVTALFKSIKYKVPELQVNCIMTDDDKVLFPSFARVFGSNIKHLLCLWHIQQSWNRQLNNKVKVEGFKDELRYKLREILKEKSKVKFDNLVNNFINKFSAIHH